VPLNKTGVCSTLEASNRLKRLDIKFDCVITSTLKRAIQTAQILVGGNTPVIHNQLCNERNFGKMQGLTIDEAKLIEPKIMYITVGNDTHSVNPPEGEPFELLRERAKRFNRFLFKNYKGLNVLIVSHSVFLQQFIGLLCGKSCIESLAIDVPNLELISFQFTGAILISKRRVILTDRKKNSW
jgi:broad specificity phosphatase PhoE